jgi:hypothetical protein
MVGAILSGGVSTFINAMRDNAECKHVRHDDNGSIVHHHRFFEHESDHIALDSAVTMVVHYQIEVTDPLGMT